MSQPNWPDESFSDYPELDENPTMPIREVDTETLNRWKLNLVAIRDSSEGYLHAYIVAAMAELEKELASRRKQFGFPNDKQRDYDEERDFE